jgi:sialate O-acetylesterase
MMRNFHSLNAIVLLIAVSRIAEADVRLPGMFSDSMVLQRDSKLPIWGWAAPGEKVTVEIAGQNVTANADERGRWRVTLAPLKADSQAQEITISGQNKIIIKDVLVGEVWLCSGQSNMAFGVQYGQNAAAEIAAANYPRIRRYYARRAPAPEPLIDHRGNWVVCSPHTVAEWTATGYFFARELQNRLDVPVGIIEASKGSVPIQTFLSIDSLKSVASVRAEMEAYEQQLQERLRVLKDSKPEAVDPHAEDGPPGTLFRQPAAIYNSSIFPVAPYALRGVLWYQGEGDADRPEYYSQALPALINDWRQLWGQPLAFAVVQLSNFKRPQREAINQGWSDFREAQLRGVQSVKNAGIVTTIDIGEAFNIHPKNKQEVGRRLALWALANVYRKDLVWSGPIFRSMKIEGERIRISFDHAHGGLRTKGEGLKGFAIADVSKVFRFAQAKIEGDVVVVWSDKIREPVAVRYAWAENPICNLFNDADLPARPFRTDEWAISDVKAAEDEKFGK